MPEKTKRGRKPYLTPSEAKRRRLERYRERRKRYINLGAEVEKWRQLKEELNIPSDENLAKILMDYYRCDGVSLLDTASKARQTTVDKGNDDSTSTCTSINESGQPLRSTTLNKLPEKKIPQIDSPAGLSIEHYDTETDSTEDSVESAEEFVEMTSCLGPNNFVGTGLKNSAVEEEVLNFEEDHPDENLCGVEEPVPISSNARLDKNIHAMRTGIVFDACLMSLARKAFKQCEWRNCNSELDLELKVVATAMKIITRCRSGHKSVWWSQPLLKEIPAELKFPHILHQMDIWHGIEAINKKLEKLITNKVNQNLQPWIVDILNHFKYCCEHSNDDANILMSRWRSFLHHVVNVHEWQLGDGVTGTSCEHKSLTTEGSAAKKWIKAGSAAHTALREVIYDKWLVSHLNYFIRARVANELESFNDHIQMYIGKNFKYEYDGYKIRNLLAVIDYNSHVNREYQRNADGEIIYCRMYSKRTKHYRAIPTKVQKHYRYIQQLMKDLFTRPLRDTTSKPEATTVTSKQYHKNVKSKPSPASITTNIYQLCKLSNRQIM
ncbi:uncharacterized protein LOC103176683 isoform X4 [Callorhinchus milii]|uniref:uncharacterized protein LOC103176683 isoform X4 n=1 Tax=Callorhinchus milii TaxID=7868 RepID=UPI0004574A2E|nr:uncharacterized protein LOC103176683 isoform X4 [Callorhinchus milii]|eukprot:gi/632946441/ref/XP_007888559.1/ PREDICTED: uncharacterized protein LOC103176683 isoform X4 [Callorhinchus milii]